MTEIVAADIGGTHARFALADVAGERARLMGAPVTLRTGDHADFASAWRAFAQAIGRPLPRAAAIAAAGPVGGERLALTNGRWRIAPDRLAVELGLDRLVLVNDFAAVGHAVAAVRADDLRHLCGPDRAIDGEEVVSIVGPGTGLGVALLLRRGGAVHVVASEGGHGDFAPLDAIEDALLVRLRAEFGRVSTERLASGPGLARIYAALAGSETGGGRNENEAALWTAALTGDDPVAAAALERFCLILGAVAGDIALVQGAGAVVIAGGVGARLADHLPRSGFAARFCAKGRFAARMAAMPVRLLTLAEPGLVGAAVAFSRARD